MNVGKKEEHLLVYATMDSPLALNLDEAKVVNGFPKMKLIFGPGVSYCWIFIRGCKRVKSK